MFKNSPTSLFKRSSSRSVAIVLFLVGAAFYYYWENETIQVETFVCESPRIPRAFDGFRIVQISDLHDKEFGRDNRRLLEKIRAANPDMIAITGDFTQEPVLDVEFATKFVKNAKNIAPVYYVSGNHEFYVDFETQYKPLKEALEKSGANVLSCEKVDVSRGSETIVLAGIDDPSAPTTQAFAQGRSEAEIVADRLQSLELSPERYTVLAAHRPEFPGLYSNAGVDLALTGHAHGGQIRIPFIGGLYAPNQGFFPTYSGGACRVGKTTEIVSRGLGASVFPTRIFNRPQLVVCELKCCDKQL